MYANETEKVFFTAVVLDASHSDLAMGWTGCQMEKKFIVYSINSRINVVEEIGE